MWAAGGALNLARDVLGDGAGAIDPLADLRWGLADALGQAALFAAAFLQLHELQQALSTDFANFHQVKRSGSYESECY